MTQPPAKFTIGALAITAFIAVSAFRGVNLASWRAQTVAAADARASNLALVLTEYLRGSFAAGDAALQQLAIHSRRVGGAEAADAEWSAVLASTHAALPGVASLSIVDANGVIRHSTQPRIVGQSRRDQYVFRRLRDGGRDELVVDTPFTSVVDPAVYLIPLGRRLTRDDGRFAGIVVATFTPGSAGAVFTSVDVGPHGIVTVLHPSGVVLFSEPPAAAPAPVPPDGAAYITHSRTLNAPPLVVAVSLNRADVLAEWRREARTAGVFFVVVGAIVGVGLLVVFGQIDRRTAAEDAARRQLEEANAIKDEFLMNVSHELRTPLTSIYGWAQLLTSGRLGEEQRSAAIDAIHRSAEVQSRLIEDLLDLSRIITGRMRLDVDEVELGAVVKAAADSVRPAADAKAIELDVETPAAPIVVTADRDRLLQIVWNLLSNAVKFTPEHGRVTLRAETRDGAVDVMVSDTGMGIAPDFLPHVFERFRQGDMSTTRRHGGLGLGLAIARHLVELHGGTIGVESAGAGRGATFRVHLPAYAARAHATV